MGERRTSRRTARRQRNQRNLWRHRLSSRNPRDVAAARYDLVRTRIEWIPDDGDQANAYRALAEHLRVFSDNLDAPPLHVD